MRIERSKNAARNIVFGVTMKLYQILIPFIMRTIIIYFLGMEYAGLNSLFSSVLQILNLAELGVGSAMIFSMYEPIAKDDKIQICALMRLYRIYYRIIGLVIDVIGLVLLPFIPYLAKSDVPADMNIYILYLLNLGATVLTYWLYAYKNCLLNAHQREDVISKINLILNSVQYGLQIVVLVVWKNYYIFLIIALASQVIVNIVIALVVDKMYPQYHARGKLDKEKTKQINQRIRDLFTSKVGNVILRSSDAVVISSFLGLTILGIYQNYYFIINALMSIATIIFNSCLAGIGNSLLTETKDKNLRDLNIFTLIIVWLGGWSCSCLICLFQPFIEIWVGKENLLSMGVVVCLAVYFFIAEINQLLNVYKDAAGIWHEDKWRPFVTALVNLGLNILTINYLGVYGVILSTVVSIIVVGMPWLLHNIFTVLFPRKELMGYLINLFKYSAIAVVICGVTYYLNSYIKDMNVYLILGIRFLICLIVPNIMFLIILFRNSHFKSCVAIVDKVTKHKIKFLGKWSK